MSKFENTARAERAEPAAEAALSATPTRTVAADNRTSRQRLGWRLPSPIAELERG